MAFSKQQKLWRNVDVKPGQCWNWIAGKTKAGYGLGVFARERFYAHRYSWELANEQPIPEGLFVLHKCDNPACVNPDHLFIGTQADNMADKARKGRQTRGETHGKAKLTDTDVVEIRAARQGGESCRSIARRTGMSHQQISCVTRGKSWSHIQGAAHVIQ